MSRARASLGSRRGQRRPSRRWLFMFLFIAIIIASAKTCTAVTGRPNPVDTALTHVTTPLVSVFRGIGQGFGLIFSIPSALRDNTNLTAEKDLLERRIKELKHIEIRNQQLQAELDLDPPPDFTPVTARVIARPYDLWLESIWINAGSRHGVRKGNLVVNDKGVVGIVQEVQSTSCSVTLISSPALALGAYAGKNVVEGVIHGYDATSTKFDLVPAGSPVAIGDELFTTGEETFPGGVNNRPKGIYIGIVQRVVTSGGFLDITVEPAAKANQLGVVMVYTK